MRTNRLLIAAGCGLFVVVVSLWAQVRKPGLWELTTTQTWQQSPFPAAAAGGTHTIQVCLTQEQIDKYGAITPHSPGCQITNVSKTANSMTADMNCTGRMNGKGTLEATFTDSEHARGKMHFVGTMRIGADSKPVEWTSESTSVFKGSDCGNVKPVSER